MQAIVIEGTDDVENMGGVYRIPVMRRGTHSCDLIITRNTAEMMVAQLIDRMAEDDKRPSNLVCFAPINAAKRGAKS